MPNAKPTVVIIDDDPELRASAARPLQSLDLDAHAICRHFRLPKSDPPDCPTSVLDVRLPGQSGLDFQRDLAAAHRELPIISITGHNDIPMTVQAMKVRSSS
jgi:FixJ family two-component response regulator